MGLLPDEHNWVASSLPGGSPGYAYGGPCTIDSSLLFGRLPLCLVSEQEIWLQQPPNSWGYWDFYQTNTDRHSYHSTGTNRWTRTDTATRISTLWCSGQTAELIQEIQAKGPHLFFTEGFVGPFGLDQSFIELYNPSDSGLNLSSYRLEFRETSGALVNLIPLNHLFPAVGAQTVILIAENPQRLSLSPKTNQSLWFQTWPTWPSGYQTFTVYLCSAHLDLDSLPWPLNTVQSGRSIERLSKNSPWQQSVSQDGKSPGEFEIRKPFKESIPMLSNRTISESQPECEIRCYSEQACHRSAFLFTSQGVPARMLFEQNCPAGEFYFAIYRDNLAPVSNSILLLLEKSASGETKKHHFRISRLD